MPARLNLLRPISTQMLAGPTRLLGLTMFLHVASPVPTVDPKTDDELVRPARDGTLRVGVFRRRAWCRLRAPRDAGRSLANMRAIALALTLPRPETPAPRRRDCAPSPRPRRARRQRGRAAGGPRPCQVAHQSGGGSTQRGWRCQCACLGRRVLELTRVDLPCSTAPGLQLCSVSGLRPTWRRSTPILSSLACSYLHGRVPPSSPIRSNEHSSRGIERRGATLSGRLESTLTGHSVRAQF
jgi:hypothetical protein